MDKNFAVNGTFGGVLPVLAQNASTLTNFKTTNAISYKVDGNVFALAATANITPAMPATITVPLVSTTSVGIYVSPAGTFSYTQGQTYLNTALASTFAGTQSTAVYLTAGLPEEVPGKALLGYAIIQTTSTGTFTGGTTNLNAANITTTYVDKGVYTGK